MKGVQKLEDELKQALADKAAAEERAAGLEVQIVVEAKAAEKSSKRARKAEEDRNRTLNELEVSSPRHPHHLQSTEGLWRACLHIAE